MTYGLRRQPALDRLLRQQSRRQHHRWVRGVGAAGDRRDDHRAVASPARCVPPPSPRRPRVFEEAYRSVSAGLPPSFSNSPTAMGSAVLRGRCDAILEGGAEVLACTAGSATRSCGRRGPARLGCDRRQVQLQQLIELRELASRVGAEEPLLLGVALDQIHQLGRAAGQRAGSAASRRPPGRSPRSRRTQATCWRWSRGRPG